MRKKKIKLQTDLDVCKDVLTTMTQQRDSAEHEVARLRVMLSNRTIDRDNRMSEVNHLRNLSLWECLKSRWGIS